VLPLENRPVIDGGEPLDLADIRNSLKSLMWRSCGVRRDAERLIAAAEDIDRWCSYVLARQFTDPKGWELQNMLSISRLIIRAALEREETRGVHVRTDFPATDDVHWQRHLTFRRDNP
jgi:L-aspartate oxidase